MEKYAMIYLKNSKGRVISMNYKEAIIELVEKIHNEKSLKRIYKIVMYLYTHEADSF
jgi:hypothetical protein